jgi:hypothetical protein
LQGDECLLGAHGDRFEPGTVWSRNLDDATLRATLRDGRRAGLRWILRNVPRDDRGFVRIAQSRGTIEHRVVELLNCG